MAGNQRCASGSGAHNSKLFISFFVSYKTILKTNKYKNESFQIIAATGKPFLTIEYY